MLACDYDDVVSSTSWTLDNEVVSGYPNTFSHLVEVHKHVVFTVSFAAKTDYVSQHLSSAVERDDDAYLFICKNRIENVTLIE
jgi:hypothetical protein